MSRPACLFVILTVACAAGSAADTPPAAEHWERPWHIRLPRSDLLAAWQRLKALCPPGQRPDPGFAIEDDARYASPDGDDAADGTRAHPWKSLARAAAGLRPGRVVYLLPGTYFGPVTVNVKASAEAPAALRALEPGTVRVTYPDAFVESKRAEVAKADWGAVAHRAVDAGGKDLHYSPLIEVRGTYVEIRGLHLVGARRHLPHNLYSENGIALAGGGGLGCRVLFNEIEQTGHCGVKEMGHGGRGFLVEGNFIHDVGQTHHDHAIYVPADDAVIRRNLLLNAAGYGVHAYSGPQRILVTYNILAGNDHHGIVQAGPHAVIAHNVFYQNSKGGVFFFRAGCRGAAVRNNLFFEQTAFAFDQMGDRGSTPAGNTVDYNLLASGGGRGSLSPLDTYGPHNVQADPLVTDAAKLDFRPAPRSPCIDAGDPAGHAFLGKAPDIGLHETGP